MKETSLKVVVKITEAYPTLQTAFASLSPQNRAERLRALAMVGLSLEGNGSLIQGAKKAGAVVSTSTQVPVEPVKFAVVLNEAQPKLFQAVAETPPRFRGERLRTLALLGLHVEVGRLVIGGTEDGAPERTKAPPPPTSSKPAAVRSGHSPLPALETTEIKQPPTQENAVPIKAPDSVDWVSKGVRSFARSLG